MTVAEHPIQGLMRTALESLKEMVDVNTVIGDPIETQEGQVIIPVSRVSFGFAAGGTEFGAGGKNGNRLAAYEDEGYGGGGGFPFGGGSGAGVSVQPVGFLVVGKESLRMLPVDGVRPMDKLIDVAPQILERLAGARSGGGNGGKLKLKRSGDGAATAGERKEQADRLAHRVVQELTEGGPREPGRIQRS